MKHYLITSSHTVHETSYTEGELDFANSYQLNAQISAENAKGALMEYIKKHLYLNIAFEQIDIDEHCGINTSALVDVENMEASESEIKEWKEGKIKLWDNYINFTIFELAEIKEL